MTIRMLLAERALNRPLLITPDKAAVIMQVLSGKIGVDASGLSHEASRFVGDSTERDANGRAVGYLPYRRTPEGVGIITITGSLVNRGAYVGASSGITSYEGIKHQLATVAADNRVLSVILDLQSPGGEAVGAFETAAAVRSLASVKPTVAVVNGMAASAAYAIASGATEIVTTETGVSGSIGVVMMHADYSEWLAEEGIKPTLIFAGAHKVDGNPFEPLPDSVRADLQAEINAFYGAFINTVAVGRGARLKADAARATEARTFVGEAAVKVGLADRVGTFESVLADLTSRAKAVTARRSTSSSGVTMSENQGGPAAETAGIPKADHDAAVSAARAAGRTEATMRIKAILSCDAAKGREAQAQAIAFDTDMSPDAAATVLGRWCQDIRGHRAGEPRKRARRCASQGSHPAQPEPRSTGKPFSTAPAAARPDALQPAQETDPCV
jgi:capsid assembly protease